MNVQSHPDSHNLNARLITMADMLAASERRNASMLKFGRLAVIAFVAFVVLVASVGFNLMSVAQAVNDMGGLAESGNACNPADVKTLQTQQCALQQVSMFFLTMNQLMTGMMQTPDVQQWMQEEPWPQVFNKAKQQFLQMGLPEAQAEAMAQQMVFGGMVAQTIVNAGLLVNRLREDSDELQTFPGGPIGSLRHELHLINNAVSAVPAMAAEMNVMNRQMSVMAYGVGSTMGRMGNVLPW